MVPLPVPGIYPIPVGAFVDPIFLRGILRIDFLIGISVVSPVDENIPFEVLALDGTTTNGNLISLTSAGLGTINLDSREARSRADTTITDEVILVFLVQSQISVQTIIEKLRIQADLPGLGRLRTDIPTFQRLRIRCALITAPRV